MHLKIWHKLLLAFLVTSMVILLVMVILSQQSFKRGFLEYITKRENPRIQALKNKILAAYTENAENWNFLRHNQLYWRKILRSVKNEINPRPRPPYLEMPALQRFRDMPPFAFKQGNDQSKIQPDGGSQGRTPFTPPPFLRIGLLDSEKNTLVGFYSPQQGALLPVELDGRLIAYIIYEPLTRLSSQLDRQFAQQQARSFILIGLIAFAVSILVASLLAYHFYRRIRSLQQIAQTLATGCYDIPVKIHGRDELGELGSDLDSLANTLQRNRTARQTWIADISHELRTPIAILRGEIEALQDGVRPMNSDAVASLKKETLRLQKLVDDLYQLSLSDIGALNYQKVTLHPDKILGNILQHFTQRLQQHDLSLEMHCPQHESDIVQGDEQRLIQAFSNVLENSIRYTDRGGRIKIRCTRNDQYWELHIEDTRPGVSSADISRLCERLYRVETSRNRQTGGAGLGLAIVKAIISAHQGQLHLHASELGGLHVTMSLPLHKHS